MKKFLFAILFFLFTQFGLAAVIVPSPGTGNTVPEYLKVENFVKMTPKEFEAASGKKLNFIQKLYFKKLQRKLSKADITTDGTLNEYYDQEKAKFKLDLLWFVLGAFVGPFAILFAYTSKQPKMKKKSALLGMLVFIIWFGELFLF
ncbi:MAG: hypothetical protein J5I50_02165 [Chitinophagaceae bacterium]|nr:hypothetical protein [Chitinophagaceae bacterium]